MLLPLRDAAGTLDACLDSLANQSLADFEVVAVDHGSQDATPALLRRWMGQMPNLRVHRHDQGSLLDALNAGLAWCKGRYIARMDGDDLCLSQRLELRRRGRTRRGRRSIAQRQHLDHPGVRL